jgi:hypothetical protein
LKRGLGRKVGREREPGDVGGARLVDGDGVGVVGVGAAEIGRIDKRTAVGRELRDKDVARHRARDLALQWVRGREVGRRRRSGDVDGSRRVDGDIGTVVEVRSAEVGREGHLRIDHEREPRVDGAERERDLARAREHVARGDRPSALGRGLIDVRRAVTHLAPSGVEHEVSGRVDGDALGVLDAQADAARIGARRDVEVVLEVSALAVVDEVDPRIDAFVAHVREARNARAPAASVGAAHVARNTGERIEPDDARPLARAGGCDTDVRAIAAAEHRVAVGKKQRAVARPRREAHARVGLPDVGLEPHRKRRVARRRDRHGVRRARAWCERDERCDETHGRAESKRRHRRPPRWMPPILPRGVSSSLREVFSLAQPDTAQSRRLHHLIVDVAPSPGLAGLERTNDGMRRRMKVLRRVLVLRRVATPDVAARQAEAQVHPSISHGEAFFAALRVWRNVLG